MYSFIPDNNIYICYLNEQKGTKVRLDIWLGLFFSSLWMILYRWKKGLCINIQRMYTHIYIQSNMQKSSEVARDPG